jgi:hypothetical protein
MLKKIEQTFDGKIWNSAFGENVMVLEIRNESKRQVYFSAIDLQRNTFLWKDLQPEKSWWLSLIGVFGNIVLLHKYSQEQKPEALGVLVIDVTSGNLIERFDGWMYFGVAENKLTLYQVDSNNLPTYRDIELDFNFLERNEEAIISHYSEASQYFPLIFKFLYQIINIEAQKAVDYLEVNDKIVISYYIYTENQFHNYLLITNKQKQILLHDFISSSEGIGIDTFSIKSDTLFYVKNQNQLIGYEI